MTPGKLVGFWGITLTIAMFACAALAAADKPEAKQALAVCDQLRSTLAETTTNLVETRRELEETKERLATREQAKAKGSAETSQGARIGDGRYTKVAVMNMSKVIEGYRRVADQMRELDEQKKRCELEVAEVQRKIDTYCDLPQDPEELAQAEQEVKILCELRDKIEDRNKFLDKKIEHNRAQVFSDVQAAAAVFARSRNIALVVYYNDAGEPQPKSLEAQLRTIGQSCWGGCSASGDLACTPVSLRVRMAACGMPIYAGPKIDITSEVIRVLNYNYEMKRPKESRKEIGRASCRERV